MGFPMQEYWSGLPFPSSRHPSDPGTEPASPTLAGGFFTTEPTGKPSYLLTCPQMACIKMKLQQQQKKKIRNPDLCSEKKGETPGVTVNKIPKRLSQKTRY